MKIGLDIGSTTIKAVVLNEAGQIVFRRYERHRAQIAMLCGYNTMANFNRSFKMVTHTTPSQFRKNL